jgi:glycosyltransferase involved in cell wall biosynthesis
MPDPLLDVGVVVITKNEERNIERCLRSVAWATEILVVDSGSTDRTVEIARGLGARVIERGWPGDGPQKHYGISQLGTRWCLVLDADEEITPQLAESMALHCRQGVHTAFKMRRRSFFLGRILRHGDWGRDWIVRLFDRTRHEWTTDIVHARLNVRKGDAHPLDGVVLHHSQDDIAQSLRKLNDYSDGSAIILRSRRCRTGLFGATLHKHWTFTRSFLLRAGFLDGWRGLLIAQLSAYGAYFKYVKLWELRQRSG